jgi:hypothetical protein
MNSGVVLLLAGLCLPYPWVSAQDPADQIEIAMERSENRQWKALDSHTVVDNGDTVRFRLRTSFSGYLYVFYRGSGGESAWLYPPSGTSSNWIEKSTVYWIPSASASYRVLGKPGFDVIYWLISPKPLPDREQLPAREDRVERTMIPRCPEIEDRTPCVDSRAGVVRADLPESHLSGLRPREIRINTQGETTRIAAGDQPGVFVYEFRLAHR